VNVYELFRDLGPEAMYDYDLFAVINHEGQMNNGHYTNFARFQDEVCRIVPLFSVLHVAHFVFSGIASMTISMSTCY